MKSIDITNHLRANYSCQLKCHKWWIKLFHLVDQTTMNLYVCWMHKMEELNLQIMPHLAFEITLGTYFIHDALKAWRKRAHLHMSLLQWLHYTHEQSSSKLKWQCIICKHPQCWYCAACGYKWMCRTSCFFAYYKELNCKHYS